MSCVNTKGKKKRSFWCRGEAINASQRLKKKHGTITKAYQCPECSDWHLGPDRFSCGCMSSSNDEKWAYGSAEAARQAGGYLRVYSCPNSSGYHITHT